MKYFFVYYMNLMFSALTAEDQRAVIDKCLVPLIGMAENGLRYAIQISGISLEIINDYRPELVTQLSTLIRDGRINFIGNGYSQIIQPLFPHELNCKNQLMGIEAYQRLLEYKPKICTINEMAYSEGSCESIVAAGYETILMEVNNIEAHIDDAGFDRFQSAKTKVCETQLNVLWCDTVAFQKFQKYTHGEWELDIYLEWLQEYTSGRKGYLCLYCSDAEIFGFRPVRYGTETPPRLDEWRRIERLMRRLENDTVFPDAAVGSDGNLIRLTSAEHPVVVKKQRKYNINRWAVTGKDDQNLNTYCYQLLTHALEPESGFSTNDWRNLLRLSSSDLRTHIDRDRWAEANKIKQDFESRFPNEVGSRRDWPLLSQSSKFSVSLDSNRGNNIISWPKNSPVLGRVQSGLFLKTSLMADFYSGYAVIERLGKRKISDLDYEASLVNTGNYNEISDNEGRFIKKSIVAEAINTLSIHVSIIVPSRTKEQIKPCNFTLSSEHWDIDSLYYMVRLGGSYPEKFKFGTKSFDQDAILNLNVVGSNGFCPTDGLLIIGDDDKKISFRTSQKSCFSLIRFTYDVESATKFLLRIAFVTQDIDETFDERDGQQEFQFHCELTQTI